MAKSIEKENRYATDIVFVNEYFTDKLFISEKQWEVVRSTVLKEINRTFTDKGYKVKQIDYGYASSKKYAVKIDWSE